MKNVLKQKGIKYCVVFTAVFFVCFLVARGIYGALLVTVQTETPSYKNLAHQVNADGVFVAAERKAVYGEPGLRIGKMLVKTGERVQAGAPLFQYDLEDLEKIVEEKEYELKRLEVELETMAYNNSIQESEKEKQRERAEEDLAGAQSDFSYSCSLAEEKLKQAQNEKAAFPGKSEYVRAQKELDEGYQTRLAKLEEARAAGEKVSDLKKELKQYEKELKEMLEAQWEQKNAELEQAVKEYESNLESVKRQNSQNVNQAKRALEDAKGETAKESSYTLNQMEAKRLSGELERYRSILEAEGLVTSEIEGSVLDIPAAESERVQDSALLWLADLEEGTYFEAVISRENKKYVNVGDEITIKRTADGSSLTGKIVSVRKDDKEEQYTVQAVLAEGEAGITENGSMELVKKAEKSRLAVPLSALRKENGKYFVYTVSQQNTILGSEWVVRKTEVTVEDKNESYATVGEGSLSEQDLLVTYSEKNVKEGDVVRLQER